MSDQLVPQLLKALEATGYPLELEMAVVAERKGWTVFHAIEYGDPNTGKLRELDLLLYKEIQNRRIEVRISCKSSTNKQFVFFEHDRTGYVPMGEVKCTPLVDNTAWRVGVRKVLMDLPLFSYPWGAINYTVLAGDKADREAKSLLHDGLMSVVNSAHYHLLPQDLLFDERGTVYFFVLLLRGKVFAARFDRGALTITAEQTDYAVWQGRIPIPDDYYAMQIPDVRGRRVPFLKALYWFGSYLHVEVVRDSAFGGYLNSIEKAFENLSPKQLKLFGKGWSPKYFPKIVEAPPKFQVNEKKTKDGGKRSG